MYNYMLSREENEAIAERAAGALVYLRKHGKLPSGLRAWHLFALKELMEKDEDFPYVMDMVVTGERWKRVLRHSRKQDEEDVWESEG